jgi:hypothetical protein
MLLINLIVSICEYCFTDLKGTTNIADRSLLQHSLNYLNQFPTPLVSIVAKFVSFVSGGLAGALIIIGFVGESILEGHVSPIFLHCFFV